MNIEELAKSLELTNYGTEPKWLVDTSPSTNEGMTIFGKLPIFILALSYIGWNGYDDPDVELALFSTLEEAFGCIAEAITDIEVNETQDESVTYAIYQTSKGFLVAYDDACLEFGGNILDYNTSTRTYVKNAIATYSQCHFAQNWDNEYEQEYHSPDSNKKLWSELFTELGTHKDDDRTLPSTIR